MWQTFWPDVLVAFIGAIGAPSKESVDRLLGNEALLKSLQGFEAQEARPLQDDNVWGNAYMLASHSEQAHQIITHDFVRQTTEEQQ